MLNEANPCPSRRAGRPGSYPSWRASAPNCPSIARRSPSCVGNYQFSAPGIKKAPSRQMVRNGAAESPDEATHQSKKASKRTHSLDSTRRCHRHLIENKKAAGENPPLFRRSSAIRDPSAGYNRSCESSPPTARADTQAPAAPSRASCFPGFCLRCWARFSRHGNTTATLRISLQSGTTSSAWRSGLSARPSWRRRSTARRA